MKEKITVKVYDREYQIKSEKGKEFVTDVADFVNSEISELSSDRLSNSKLDIANMALMKIAEKYFEEVNSKSKIGSKKEELNEELEKINASIREKEEIIQVKVNEIKKLEDKVNRLSIENQELNSQILKLNEKVRELSNINDEFQTRFFNLQIELVKAKEEKSK